MDANRRRSNRHAGRTRWRRAAQQILAELRKVIVGQDEVVDEVLMALFCGGHCLITGVPGLAKTLLVKTLAQILDLSFKRIQFTPDLMPADITGTEILDEEHGASRAALRARARSSRRSSWPTRSTARRRRRRRRCSRRCRSTTSPPPAGPMQLERPFFVLATQNPIELEGTYPLPEAQLDRFLFNVVMTYLSEDDEVQVVTRHDRRRAAGAGAGADGADILRDPGLRAPGAGGRRSGALRRAARRQLAARPRRASSTSSRSG